MRRGRGQRSGARSGTAAGEGIIIGLRPARNPIVRRLPLGRAVGIKEEEDNIRLVSFMQYDIGYFDLEACRVESVKNPFGPKVLTMSPV